MSNSTVNHSRNCFNISGVVQCRAFPPPLPPEILELIQLNTTLKPIFNVLSFVLLSIALIGNFSIIVTILKDPRIHGMAHMFLLNVAVADVLYALINIAGETLFIVLTMEQKKSKIIACHVMRSLVTIRFICYGASVFSIAVLSIERWYAICQPFAAARQTSFKKRIKFAAVFGTWALAILISWPLILCKKHSYIKVHTIVLAVLFLLLPFAMILITNGKIILSIKRTGLFVVSKKLGQESRRRRKHLLKLLFAIIISFVVLWLPYTVLYITLGLFSIEDLILRYKIVIVAEALVVTSYMHPALNSFMYYGFCKDFRRGLVSLMRKNTTSTIATPQ